MKAPDIAFMKRAILLAKKGLGKTSPNPPVGAVVVKEGRIVGEGYHQRAGESHAEVIALSAAGDLTQGADMYITLEPCSSYGKTMPCVDAIIAARVARVFIGSIDPNQKNRQRSLGILQSAGIACCYGLLHEKTDHLIRAFDVFINQKRPYYILKAALSLDGRIATYTGNSKWISSDLSRHFDHRLRNTVDAILVGKNTLTVDNPTLNVRNIPRPNKPIKVVLGYDETITPDANIFTDGPDKVVFFVKKGTRVRQRIPGTRIFEIEHLQEVSAQLHAMNIMSVLIEVGGGMFTSFMKEGVVDRFYFFISPVLLGGDILGIWPSYKVETVSMAPRLKNIAFQRFGDDMLISGDR